MGKNIKRSIIVLCAMIMSFQSYSQFYCNSNPVDVHGKLSVSGNRIVDQNNQAVSFAGNSMFWSNEFFGAERFYNANAVSSLKEDWGATIVRAAMGVDEFGGFLTYPNENRDRVKTVVDAAIAEDMYVIIDWHSHHAEDFRQQSIDFFKEMATLYGDNPHVIYEIYNEPIGSDWSRDIKPYAEAVIEAIREIDPDNLIIVGTPFFSQNVDVASNDPITTSTNIAYTLHFYAGTHGASLRSRAQTALNNGIALMVTEWGTVNANGDGGVNRSSTNEWMDFLETNDISHLNWSVHDKQEGASILQPGASSNGNWSDSDLTDSGLFVRDIIQNWEQFCDIAPSFDTPQQVEDLLTVTELSNFDSEGASQSITITSNVDWTVSENTDWIRVNTTSGSDNGSVNVTTLANTNTSPRSATITISGGEISRSITVNQEAAVIVNSLTVSTTSEFDSEGGSQSIAVTSNVNWTVSENADWIRVNTTRGSNNGSVNVTTSANESTSARSATIVISGGDISRSVTINQQAAPIILTASELSNFDSEGDTQTITISSNIDWRVLEEAEWIRVSAENGSGNGSVSVTALANTSTNSRTAVITVSGGIGFKRFVSVTQEASEPVIVADPIEEPVEEEPIVVVEPIEVISIPEEASGCGNVPTWTADAIYSEDGTQVVLNGVLYENKWYTQNESPEDFSEFPWSLWTVLGPCDGSAVISEEVVNETEEVVIVEEVIVEEIEEEVVDTRGASSSSCGDVPTWTADAIYSEEGTQVVLNGVLYENKWYTQNQSPEAFSEFPWSLWTVLGSCDDVAAKSLNNTFGITSYPNPFIDEINVTADDESNQVIGSLQLVDLSGKIVAVENGTTMNNLDRVARGMYLVQILNTDGQIIAVDKVVKE